MNNRWISIRRQARALLQRYDEIARAEGLPLAFTSERGSSAVLKHILEKCFDRPYNISRERNFPPNVKGKINEQIRTVSVDRNLPRTLQDFIIAHEIAHLWLKHSPRPCSGGAANVVLAPLGSAMPPETDKTINQEPYAGDLECRDGVVPSYRENDRIELEANIFASELLAPLSLVRGRLENNADWEVAEFAAYFGVSEDAMRNQLMAALIACPQPDTIEQELVSKPPLQLDPKQRDAVVCPTPALIVAGPGAGKTGVLTERYIHLVQQEKVAPSRILALTFSNKAAAEMHERITARLPDLAHEVVVHTYHSYGRLLLQGYGTHIELDEEPSILSETDSFVLARNNIHDLPMGEFANLNDPTRSLGLLIGKVQSLKEAQISPEEFESRVIKWAREIKKNENYKGTQDWKTAVQCRDIAKFYKAYEKLRLAKGCVDYADLISLAISLFSVENVAPALRGLYDRVLVDEFQDVNRACGQLVQLTDGGRGIVWAVADPRQTIYSFRGASVSHLARFEQDFPGAKITFLDVNYRSVEEIVRAGDAIQLPLIAQSKVFSPPPMRADKGLSQDNAPVVTVSECPARGQEIAHLVGNVAHAIETVVPDQVAILCRDKWRAKDICQALEDAGIPTSWSGQLEEQDAFKDMMAVLQLATNQPQSLLRLNGMEEHRLCETDTQLILHAAGKKGGHLYQALLDARHGLLPDVSLEGRAKAEQLRRLSYKLAAHHKKWKRTAWQILSIYLLEESRWLREKLASPTPENRRYIAAMCQVIALAREFGHKSSFAGAKDVRSFLDYVASARESKSLPSVDSTEVIADAVNVLTIHKSKGLQWDVVFVPHWRERTVGQRPEDAAIPHHLMGIDTKHKTSDDKYSEACLNYVAVTRAKERLFLSTFTSIDDYSQQSPFLPQIVEALERTGDVTHLRPRGAFWRPQAETYPLTPFEDEHIPYSMIRQYEYCPRRAKYDYLYNLRTESTGFRFFKRQLGKALEWIADEIGENRRPTPAEVEQRIDSLWEENTRSMQKMSRLYRDQALLCASAFARRLTPGVKVILGQVWDLEVPNTIPPVKIAFKVDERQETSPPKICLHKLELKHPNHHRDNVWSLYATLIADGHIEFELAYLALDDQTPIDLEKWGQSRIEQLYKRAKSIRKGEFPPTPKGRGKEMCHRCPYNLTCPA